MPGISPSHHKIPNAWREGERAEITSQIRAVLGDLRDALESVEFSAGVEGLKRVMVRLKRDEIKGKRAQIGRQLTATFPGSSLVGREDGAPEADDLVRFAIYLEGSS